MIHDQQPGTISGYVRANDVHYLHKVAASEWTGGSVVYSHLRGTPNSTISLKFSDCSFFFVKQFTFFGLRYQVN